MIHKQKPNGSELNLVVFGSFYFIYFYISLFFCSTTIRYFITGLLFHISCCALCVQAISHPFGQNRTEPNGARMWMWNKFIVGGEEMKKTKKLNRTGNFFTFSLSILLVFILSKCELTECVYCSKCVVERLIRTGFRRSGIASAISLREQWYSFFFSFIRIEFSAFFKNKRKYEKGKIRFDSHLIVWFFFYYLFYTYLGSSPVQ